jgi:hypothetical protein
MQAAAMRFSLVGAIAGWGLVDGCGGPSQSIEPVQTPASVEPRFFPSHEHQAGTAECRVDADCGERANTKNTLCYHGDFCLPLCKDHWGDCNQDYRDGCETPIKHATYCDGDPRIAQEGKSKPLAGVFVVGEGVGRGAFHFGDFSAGLAPYRQQLQSCYEQALEVAPNLEGTLNYELTLTESGRIASLRPTTSDVAVPRLEACIRDYAEAVHLSSRPAGGSVTFTCRFVFAN